MRRLPLESPDIRFPISHRSGFSTRVLGFAPFPIAAFISRWCGSVSSF